MSPLIIRASVLAFFSLIVVSFSNAQLLNTQNISADLQTDFQYNTDTTKDKAMGFHGYLNAVYRYSGFELGLRYETYMPPLVGYEQVLKEGQGIAHRYVSFQHGRVKATAGNFYTQFGNGIVYRSYEARALGLDNALDGIKVEYNIPEKVSLVALTGKLRNLFNDDYSNKSIMRGASGDVNISNFFSSRPKVIVNAGASYLDRYFPFFDFIDTSIVDTLHPLVNVYSGRLSVQYKGITAGTEMAGKSYDPTQTGYFLDTAKGYCYLFNAGYSTKGLGVILQYKEVKNFDFLADPTNTAVDQRLNYIPPLSKQHGFKLLTKYPYQTQYLNERGYQAEVNYSPKLGTSVSLNHTRIDALKKDTNETGRYYTETSAEIEHKISSKIRAALAYQYLEIDIKKILFEGSDSDKVVHAHTTALEAVYRIYRRHSLRADIEYLFTEDYKKDWVYGLLEYTWAPKISISVADEYNLGMEKKHYISSALTYIEGNSRFSLSYGKQNGGTVCVGGVCRIVPPFEGITFSIITKL